MSKAQEPDRHCGPAAVAALFAHRPADVLRFFYTPMRRQERVYHLTQTSYSFPAQSPRSRTLHFISNVALEALPSGQEDGAQWLVHSNQIIYEMRTGDFKQVGIGELHPIVASVEHRLREEQGQPRIVRKKILLINRDAWLGNMTFMM